MASRRSFSASPSAANPTTESMILASSWEDVVPPILKTLGWYLVFILYPDVDLVSPAIIVKSSPAIARVEPPLSVYLFDWLDGS